MGSWPAAMAEGGSHRRGIWCESVVVISLSGPGRRPRSLLVSALGRGFIHMDNRTLQATQLMQAMAQPWPMRRPGRSFWPEFQGNGCPSLWSCSAWATNASSAASVAMFRLSQPGSLY